MLQSNLSTIQTMYQSGDNIDGLWHYPSSGFNYLHNDKWIVCYFPRYLSIFVTVGENIIKQLPHYVLLF